MFVKTFASETVDCTKTPIEILKYITMGPNSRAKTKKTTMTDSSTTMPSYENVPATDEKEEDDDNSNDDGEVNDDLDMFTDDNKYDKNDEKKVKRQERKANLIMAHADKEAMKDEQYSAEMNEKFKFKGKAFKRYQVDL